MLEDPARRFLTLAGERALGLDTDAALTNLERALALTPPSHPDRPHALTRFGEAAFHAGRSADAKEALEAAINAFKERHDLHGQAHAMHTLSDALRVLGDPRWAELPAEALALLEPLPANAALVDALTEVAATEISGPSPGGHRLGRTRAHTRRPARSWPPCAGRSATAAPLADASAMPVASTTCEMRSGSPPSGQGREVAILHNNLGILLWAYHGPQAALAELRTGIAYASTRGLAEMAAATNATMLDSTHRHGPARRGTHTRRPRSQNTSNDDPPTSPRCARTGADPHPPRPADRDSRLSRLARNHQPRRGTADSMVNWPGGSRPRPRRSSETTAAPQHSSPKSPRHPKPATPLLRRLPARARPRRARPRRPDLAQALTTDWRRHHPLRTPRTRHHHGHTRRSPPATTPQPTATPTPPTAGTSSGLSPSKDSLSLGHGRCLINLGQPQEAAPILHQARALFGSPWRGTRARRDRHSPPTSCRPQLLEHDRYGMRDQQLYAKYGLDSEEIALIEAKVKPME